MVDKRDVSPPQSALASRPSRVARRILFAVEAADVVRLEGELSQVAEARQRSLPADQLEQMELLEAIAEDLAGAMRHSTEPPAGGGAQMRLLRHLAQLG